MDERIYWIWLSRIPNIGIKKFNILINKYKSIDNIWKLKKEDLERNKGIGEKTISELLDERYRIGLNKYLEYIIKNKIELIGINNEKYPKRLKQIYDPPLMLYAKGNIQILKDINSIAMVGGRNCSEYGKKIALELSEFLSKRKINIISGLARGIDTYSHIGCLKGTGKAIAVLGSGLNELYPSENIRLAKEIIYSGGTIISEYGIGVKPSKLNFPARNRIISALSNKIVIIEARKDSGSIITADYALDQGKEIYAVPGNINNKLSEGSNELIKEGANILTNYEDLIY